MRLPKRRTKRCGYAFEARKMDGTLVLFYLEGELVVEDKTQHLVI